jgi:hypothetical protein
MALAGCLRFLLRVPQSASFGITQHRRYSHAPQMMVLTLTHEVTFEPCTHAQIERDADYELVDGL